MRETPIGATASAEVAVSGGRPLVVDAAVRCRVELPVPDLEAIPVAGDVVEDALAWFEENVAEVPDLPTHLEFEIPFHWEYSGPPRLDPLASAVTLEAEFAPGERSLAAALAGSANERRNVELSPVAVLDARPTVLFDQNMNAGAELGIAGFQGGAARIFAAGDFCLRPEVEQVVLYRAPKNGDSASVAWEEVARLGASNPARRLWGFWRADGDPAAPSEAGRRLLKFWTANPFDSLNLLPGHQVHLLTQNLPAAAAGPRVATTIRQKDLRLKSLAGMVDGGTYGEICIHGKRLYVEMKRGLERRRASAANRWNIDGVTIEGLRLMLRPSLVHQKQAELFAAPSPGAPSVTFIFPEPVLRVSLFPGDKPLPIPSDLTMTAGAPAASLIVDGTRTFQGRQKRVRRLHRGARCGREAATAVQNIGGGLEITSQTPFTCLSVQCKKELSGGKVCWQTAAVLEAVENELQDETAIEQTLRQSQLDPPLLNADSYYKLEVLTTLRFSGDDRPDLLDVIANLDGDMENFLEAHSGTGRGERRAWYFQTDGPPTDLRRYITACFPG